MIGSISFHEKGIRGTYNQVVTQQAEEKDLKYVSFDSPRSYLILVVQRMKECIFEDVLMIAAILPVRPRNLSAQIPRLTYEVAVQWN
jgi:hypothetical protein